MDSIIDMLFSALESVYNGEEIEIKLILSFVLSFILGGILSGTSVAFFYNKVINYSQKKEIAKLKEEKEALIQEKDALQKKYDKFKSYYDGYYINLASEPDFLDPLLIDDFCKTK